MSWLEEYEAAQERRIRSRFVEGDPDECWPWLGYINHARGGYGELYMAGRTAKAHRAVYDRRRMSDVHRIVQATGSSAVAAAVALDFCEGDVAAACALLWSLDKPAGAA